MSAVRRANVASSLAVLMKSGCSLEQAKLVASDIIRSRGSHLRNKGGVVERSLLEAADSVLRNSEAVQDTNPSYTSAPEVNTDAKNIKFPPASKYSTYLQCTTDLATNYSADKNIADQYCRQVNADEGQSGPSSFHGGQRRTIKRSGNYSSADGVSGGKFRSVTKIPAKGTLKKASVETPPAWSVAVFSGNPPNLGTGESSLKSASDKSYLETISSISIGDTLERHQNIREAISAERDQTRLKQASTVPKHLLCYASDLI